MSLRGILIVAEQARRRMVGIDLVTTFASYGKAKAGDNPHDTEAVASGLRAYFRRVGTAPQLPRRPRQIVQNLHALGRVLELNRQDLDVLLFLLTVAHDREFSELVGSFPAPTLGAAAKVIAAGLNCSLSSVLSSLRQGARLQSSGVVVENERQNDVPCRLELKPGVVELLLQPGLDAARILKRYFPNEEATRLRWADFSHLGDAPTLIAKLLQTALEKRRAGINVLLYGATGTGKTELARLLAKKIGARLHAAGTASSDGESASAEERLSSLLMGNRLVRGGGSLLMFDEFEDLFSFEGFNPRGLAGIRSTQMSKQWFNLLLDTNPVPTLWISNSTERVDPAFLRRFAFALEFRPLGARQRARVLERHLKGSLPSADVTSLAERFEVSPAQLGAAVAASCLMSETGSPELLTLEKVLAPIEKLVTGVDSRDRKHFDAATFSIDALNSPDDLEGMAASLATWKPSGRLGVSLCLYGPPGTGKSEYVKYLAHRMGRRVVYRRVSDIQSMWVGEAEKNIAKAFREAEDDDAVLLFDEADSFLRDRRKARASWEVSQVNEFLQQLESFRGVVACTTNLWKDLDEASLRRFVFKVELRFLKPAQAVALFETYFARVMTPSNAETGLRARSNLEQLPNLTPGDFAAVARRIQVFNKKHPAEAIVEMLKGEVAAKGAVARPIGIRSGGS